MLIAELFLFGGDRREVALSFALLQVGALAGLIALAGRRETDRLAGLETGGSLFLLVALWVALQFLPWPTGMSRRAWQEVGTGGSVTIDRFATAVELGKLAGLGAVTLAGALLVRTERLSRPAYGALGVAAGLYLAWSVAGYYTPSLGVEITGDHRLSASLITPNAAGGAFGIFAAYGSVAVLMSVSRALPDAAAWQEGLGKGALRAWPWLILVLLSLWALGLTASRGAALSTLIGLGVAALTCVSGISGPSAKRIRVTFAGVAALLLAAVLLVLIAGGPLAGRLSTGRAITTDRWDYWSLYLGALPLVPINGLGLGTFGRFNAFMANSAGASEFWTLGAMHNVYLQWLFEAGAGGLMMFLLIGYILTKAGLSLRRPRPGRRWASAALSVSAVVVTHSFVDIDLQVVGIAALWAFLLGAGLGASIPFSRRGALAKRAGREAEGKPARGI